MKCPDCGRALSMSKHYDATYEWFECPKCEGCFTYDEIIEGGIDESSESEEAEAQGNRSRSQGKKARGGRGKKRAHSNGKNGGVQASDDEIRERIKRTGPVAKGKKRRTEIAEDEERGEELTKQIVTNTIESEERHFKHHKDEVDTREVVAVWGDEIQSIYEDMGVELDEVNAQDKALILWREIHLKGATAREQEVEHTLCKEHS